LITEVNGNLFNALKRDGVVAIAHQVNCQGVMGAGLAKQIKVEYPEVYNQYKKAYYKTSDLLGKVQPVSLSNGKAVINMFAQFDYGRDKVYTDYDAFKTCLIKIRDHINGAVAIPKGIGCGLAGGDWSKVMDIINDVYAESDKELYIYSL